jgi:hypothetical protein
MNRYNLKVLTGNGTYDVSILAHGFIYAEAGCYYFYERDAENRKTEVAYYPIQKTIIESIDYDAE